MTGRIPPRHALAEHFLKFEEAYAMNRALIGQGFELRPLCRARVAGTLLSVRLVWRWRCDDECAVLSLRVRLAIPA